MTADFNVINFLLYHNESGSFKIILYIEIYRYHINKHNPLTAMIILASFYRPNNYLFNLFASSTSWQINFFSHILSRYLTNHKLCKHLCNLHFVLSPLKGTQGISTCHRYMFFRIQFEKFVNKFLCLQLIIPPNCTKL